MVFRSTGIVELGNDSNLAPIKQDIVPIDIPSTIPADGVVLLDVVKFGCDTEETYSQPSPPTVENLDYGTYEPFPGTVSITYDGDEITSIITTNDFGVKAANFIYTTGEVSQVNINNYGIASRQVTFVRIGGNITQINIIDN